MPNQAATTNLLPAETIFAAAILKAKPATPLYFTLCQHFATEMRRAITGRICTPERMARLYPIFREINEESDDMERAEILYELKDRQAAERRERRRLKKLEVTNA